MDSGGHGMHMMRPLHVSPGRGENLFGSIVVGTDGSDTAKEAVRQAPELAASLNAQLYVVSAYEPVPEGRLRSERKDAPDDLQWSINPREDVEATLSDAEDNI